jgi:membrane fusion protein (multidrug efflux system)
VKPNQDRPNVTELREAVPLRPDMPRPDSPPPVAPTPAVPPERSRVRKRYAVPLALLLAVLGYVGNWAHGWWTDGRFFVTTDDAYVRADVVVIAARVAGYIAAVNVKNGDVVRAGDVIARIDDGDYVLAIDAAKARIVTQRSSIERLARQVDASRAAAAQAQTQIAGARAELARAAADFNRLSALSAQDFASRARFDQARADRDRAASSFAWAEAAYVAAQAQIDVAVAQRVEAEQAIGELDAALARAERDRVFTVLRAPFDGVVGNKAVDVGGLVQIGTRLVALVPRDRVWVEANFKETQLAQLIPGQRAELTLDALPHLKLVGRVESFSPASGAVFSLLPPENATGNFTKIVQRVPVRIALPPEALAEGLIRPGLSVVVRVDSRQKP